MFFSAGRLPEAYVFVAVGPARLTGTMVTRLQAKRGMFLPGRTPDFYTFTHLTLFTSCIVGQRPRSLPCRSVEPYSMAQRGACWRGCLRQSARPSIYEVAFAANDSRRFRDTTTCEGGLAFHTLQAGFASCAAGKLIQARAACKSASDAAEAVGILSFPDLGSGFALRC